MSKPTTVTDILQACEDIANRKNILIRPELRLICGRCEKVIIRKYKKPMNPELYEKRMAKLIAYHRNKCTPDEGATSATR